MRFTIQSDAAKPSGWRRAMNICDDAVVFFVMCAVAVAGTLFIAFCYNFYYRPYVLELFSCEQRQSMAHAVLDNNECDPVVRAKTKDMNRCDEAQRALIYSCYQTAVGNVMRNTWICDDKGRCSVLGINITDTLHTSMYYGSRIFLAVFAIFCLKILLTLHHRFDTDRRLPFGASYGGMQYVPVYYGAGAHLAPSAPSQAKGTL